MATRMARSPDAWISGGAVLAMRLALSCLNLWPIHGSYEAEPVASARCTCSYTDNTWLHVITDVIVSMKGRSLREILTAATPDPSVLAMLGSRRCDSATLDVAQGLRSNSPPDAFQFCAPGQALLSMLCAHRFLLSNDLDAATNWAQGAGHLLDFVEDCMDAEAPFPVLAADLRAWVRSWNNRPPLPYDAAQQAALVFEGAFALRPNGLPELHGCLPLKDPECFPAGTKSAVEVCSGCCNTTKWGHGGNPDCWAAPYTAGRCCNQATTRSAVPPERPAPKDEESEVLRLRQEIASLLQAQQGQHFVVAEEQDQRLGIAYAGLPPQRVFIQSVARGSWAGRVGITAGSELLSVNEQAVKELTPEALGEHMRNVRPLRLVFARAAPASEVEELEKELLEAKSALTSAQADMEGMSAEIRRYQALEGQLANATTALAMSREMAERRDSELTRLEAAEHQLKEELELSAAAREALQRELNDVVADSKSAREAIEIELNETKNALATLRADAERKAKDVARHEALERSLAAARAVRALANEETRHACGEDPDRERRRQERLLEKEMELISLRKELEAAKAAPGDVKLAEAEAFCESPLFGGGNETLTESGSGCGWLSRELREAKSALNAAETQIAAMTSDAETAAVDMAAMKQALSRAEGIAANGTGVQGWSADGMPAEDQPDGPSEWQFLFERARSEALNFYAVLQEGRLRDIVRSQAEHWLNALAMGEPNALLAVSGILVSLLALSCLGCLGAE